MPLWRLTAFGGLTLRDSEDRLPPLAGQRRPLALLALLAVAGDAGQSRDKLLPYLWPESDEERARNALRQLLYTVRKGLGRDELLLGTADLRLNPELFTSDVQEFELARQRHELDRAVELYGGPFLDGFHLASAPEFDYWAASARTEFAARAGSAMESVARGAAARGDATAAVGWWRRLAALDPLDSRVALELMQAWVAAGNAAGALQHARVHEALVRQELGGAPSADIGALVERIRTSRPASEGAAGNAASDVLAPSHARVERRVPASAPPAAEGVVPRPRLREQLQAALAERYQIRHELPRCEGTTRLFAARDLRHERAVVLKVLHPSLASSIDLQRFLREIALTARLTHPHIVPLLDSGTVPSTLSRGQPWYAVPDLGGETLRERVSREEPPSRAWAIDLVADLAEALAYAHAQGVVHRDVRPETILLTGQQALLESFGVAGALATAADPRLTASGMFIGAPAYASPEQARGTAAAPASDVYSLGIVLYELLAGEPPFTGPTPQAILAKRARAAPGWEALMALDTELQDVLRRMLAEDPTRRPSAAELEEVLRPPAHLEGEGQARGPGLGSVVGGLVRGVASRLGWHRQ